MNQIEDEHLENILRTARRGKGIAERRDLTNIVDLFQHIIDEVARARALEATTITDVPLTCEWSRTLSHGGKRYRTSCGNDVWWRTAFNPSPGICEHCHRQITLKC